MKRTGKNSWAGFFAASLMAFLCLPLPGGNFLGLFLNKTQGVAVSQPAEKEPLVVTVPGNVPWTDTGMDVEGNQEMVFKAEGKMSLQTGNPEAECSPDGYDLRTIQQPVPEKNLGALIGKVVISVTVTVDEKTGEEKKQEVAEIFFIGSENRLEMPAKGRLYLGINENVVGDNAGEFRVTVTTAKKEAQ
jgi:hypothetical protein